MFSEENLIKECKKYNIAAQRELYEHFAPRMRYVCSRYVYSTDEVNDIIQESFLKVFDNINKFKGEGSFEGWIKRIVINTALYHYKKNKKHYYHSDVNEINDNEIDKVNVDREISQAEELEASDLMDGNNTLTIIEKANFSEQELLDTINVLSDDFKMVFTLYFIDNYKHKDIALTLGIDESTSRTRLMRARNMVQKELVKRCKEKINVANDK